MGKGFQDHGYCYEEEPPLAGCVISAKPFETTLVEQTIRHRFSQVRIGKLVGDQIYDSDPLEKVLKA